MADALRDFRKQDLESDLEDVHDEALKRFQVLQDRERHSRELATNDKIFIESEGGAYDDILGGSTTSSTITTGTTETAKAPPPRYQIDRVTPVLEQALSDQRENEIQIKVLGALNSDKKTDDTMNGLIKNIESMSDASYSYDNAFDETQKCGYGGWQIVTEYADDSFEHNIFIRPIKDAATSLWFGPSELYTKEDSLYAFVIWTMDIDEFKAQYPKAEVTDFAENILQRIGTFREWFDTDTHSLRMAAYWRKKPIKKEIVMLTDGNVYDMEEGFKKVQDELAQPSQQNPQGLQVAKFPDGEDMIRTVDTYKIERYIMNGAEILKGPQEWLGKYIPLIPEFGVQTTIEGHEIVRGRVRKTKDASRVYNYAISGAIKQTAISPQDVLMMTPEQARGHTAEIENLNVTDAAALIYNHEEGQPPPFRSQGRALDQALIGLSQTMAENIAATVGGTVGTAVDGTAADGRSGDAILEGRINSEKGNSIYHTNHVRSVAYGGKILADLIPRIMSGELQRRIIMPDGKTEFRTVNQTTVDRDTGEEIITNDLSANKYDIIPDVGPAYRSKRQEASARLQALAEKNPAFANRPDLIVQGLDLGDSDELYDSLRETMIQEGRVRATDEEREEFGIDEREQIKQQLIPELTEQITNEANVRLINANATMLESQAKALLSQQDVAQLKADTENIGQTFKNITEAFKGFKTQMEALQIQAELGVPTTQQNHDNRITQQEVAETAQQEVNQGPNIEQLEEFEGALDEPAPGQQLPGPEPQQPLLPGQ